MSIGLSEFMYPPESVAAPSGRLPLAGYNSDASTIAHLFSNSNSFAPFNFDEYASAKSDSHKPETGEGSKPHPTNEKSVPVQVLPKTACPFSYASVVNGRKESTEPLNLNPLISDAGSGYKAIRIPQNLYNDRLEACKFSLVGRIMLAKGESPWRQEDLKLRLSKIWGLNMNWKLISLGKGFYHIVFQSAEALDLVWNRGAIVLKPGVIRFSSWKPGFDPSAHKLTNAQVWVRLHNLPWEFWDRSILTSIALGIGIPIRFDSKTIDGEFGHFARILIDVDLQKPLKDFVRVDTDMSKLWVGVEYETLPQFCEICSSIGHISSACRRHKPEFQKMPASSQQENWEKDPIPEDLRARAKIREKRVWQRKPPHTSLDRNSNDVGQSINVQTALKTPEGIPKVLESIEIEVPSPLCLELHDQGTGKEIIPHANAVPLESPLNIRPLNISIDSPVLQQVEQNSDRATVSWANQGSSWADQFGTDSDSEDAIDTEHIEQLWHSQVTHSSMYDNVNSDPDGWYTVKRKGKYTPVSQIEIPVSRDSRNYFPVGTRKSKRQVRLPKKYQPS